jgi:hypothetical protein
MKKIIFSIITMIAFATFFTACNKDKVVNPEVTEEELITTLKLTVTNSNNVSHSFVYRIQNGFGSTVQGSIQIDTIRLSPNEVYSYSLQVLNEADNASEDVTEEVISEKDEHLFFFTSSPATGAGSMAQSDGSTDNAGHPFNQSGKLTTGAAGSGSLTLTLLHEPTDKHGTSTAAAGGDTDAEGTFPVALQ